MFMYLTCILLTNVEVTLFRMCKYLKGSKVGRRFPIQRKNTCSPTMKHLIGCFFSSPIIYENHMLLGLPVLFVFLK